MRQILITAISIAFYAIPYALYPSYVQAANCNPNGPIDPSPGAWVEIEACKADPNNPGNYGQEWACFNDSGVPVGIKFSYDTTDPTCKQNPQQTQGSTCTYSENCDAGEGPTSGQHSCTGMNQSGTCKYDSGVAPNCGVCQPISTPVQQTPTIQVPKNPSSEEQAVYNQCQLNSPDGICPQTDTSGDIWHTIWGALSNFFHFPAQNPNRLTDQSVQLHQNNFPSQTQPTAQDSGQKSDQSLGTQNGFYSINIPNQITNTSQQQDIFQKEQLFEQSNFPSVVHPITGMGSN